MPLAYAKDETSSASVSERAQSGRTAPPRMPDGRDRGAHPPGGQPHHHRARRSDMEPRVPRDAGPTGRLSSGSAGAKPPAKGALVTAVVDTSTCIDRLRGRIPSVAARLRRCRPSDIGLPAVALAELRTGAELSNDPAGSHRRVDLLAGQIEVLPFTPEEAKAFGAINADLFRRGLARHVDDLDKLIAAHAVVRRLPVVTSNEKHFSRLRGVAWENWRTGGRGRV